MLRLVCVLCVLLVTSPVLARSAEDQEAIRIFGLIEGDTPRLVTLEEIRALPAVEFETFDHWDQKVRRYRGVALMAFLESLGLQEGASELDIVAVNDYQVTIPFDQIRKFGHVLSYEMDGKAYDDLPDRDNKGPVAIAIDFDSSGADPDLYKHHLAWWIEKMTVR